MGRIGIPVAVAESGDCTLPANVHVALYRIAQEALNNVIKHARASRVDVRLECDTGPTGRAVGLLIRDDGQGFDPEAARPDHLGLGIMRERAEAIGADLQIESIVGQGTQVSLFWRESVG
jgi:signal transduction histidine kinase